MFIKLDEKLNKRLISMLLVFVMLFGMFPMSAFAEDESAEEAEQKHVHAWSDWTATEPTCTEAGEKTRECAGCGETETEKVDAKGHAWGDWTVTAEPGCTEDGSMERVCAVCGEVETAAIPAAHDWDEWVLTVDATCTAAGERVRVCKVKDCDGKDTEATPALGHSFGEWTTVTEPACTAAGVKAHVCATCGEKETEAIPALGHSFGEWETVTEPTCTNAGVKVRECAACGEKETEEIPALGHKFGKWATETEATCTEEGVQVHVCTACEAEEREAIPALGHKFGKWATETEATCTEEGVQVRVCAACEAEEREAIPALGHSFGEWKVTTEATCTEDGEKTRECENCDKVETEVITAPGHSWDAEDEDEEATCTECGEHREAKYNIIVDGERFRKVNEDDPDPETAEDWANMFYSFVPTGDWAKDLLSVASTQKGYTGLRLENKNGEVKTYTRYGDWYGFPFESWCAMFISFCLNYAQVPSSAMPREASCERWIKALSGKDIYADSENYTPVPGDLIYFDYTDSMDLNQPDGRSDHVGIVFSVDEEAGIVTTIEGAICNSVAKHSYALTDRSIMGYGILPKNPAQTAPAAEEEIHSNTISATDKVSYEISVTYSDTVGIPMKGTALIVTEILPGTEVYENYVKQSAETLSTSENSISFARVFDITIVDAEDPGVVYEPTGYVDVQITLFDAEPVQAESLDVVHFEEENRANVCETSADGATLDFSTDSFSVYVVIGHEEGEVEKPRVIFHFIADGAVSYPNDCYKGTPYQFINKHNEFQTTQILADGESLELITDPKNQADRYFYGWYIVEPKVIDNITDDYGVGLSGDALYFTWPEHPDQLFFETAITITESNVAIGDTVHWTLSGVSGSGKVDKDGNVHVFVAPVYENYNFVNFMQYPREAGANTNTLMTRKLIALGSAEQVEVKISDIRASSSDPVYLIFTGWEYNAGTAADPVWVQVQTVDYTGAEICDPGRDGTYITLDLEDRFGADLYPIFVEARWVDFFAGVSGSGAAYVASRFLESWGAATPAGTPEIHNRNVFTSLATTTRTGYDFDGWYAFADIDPDTGEIRNLDDPAEIEFSYIDVNDKFTTRTVKVSTKAIKVVNADGRINNCGVYSVTDNGNGTGTLNHDDSGEILFEASGGRLKFFDALDRLKLCANWNSENSRITLVYWTENAQDRNTVISTVEKENYTASAVRIITTDELTSALTGTYASGSTITLSELKLFKDGSVNILDTDYLDDAGAVPDGEQIFYERNETLSDASKVISGDGSTIFNVYFSRLTFKLVFHIGRDGYVKTSGRQSTDVGWDGNWIQFMFNDAKITELGYTGTGTSQSGRFSMTYNVTGKTYDSYYVTNNENVMGYYVPDDSENVYVITAKYGAYIGDRWPTPVNPNFNFTNPNNSSYTMYTWAAYYGSLYCRIANERPTWGGQQGNNPDLNGVYEYMSAELCSNRAGTALINNNGVHHIVAYFGRTSNEDRYKHYHILYEAIPGTYDPNSVTLVPGSSYSSMNRTTWSSDIAHVTSSVIEGRTFYEVSDSVVISNVDPQYQMGWELDGYEYFYSCYTDEGYDNHVYFFYTPRQYTLTFMYETGQITDTYYYTQSLEHALDCDRHDHYEPEKEGYTFEGWYTNEAGIGDPFDFAAETMPSNSLVLYPVLKVLQYTVKVDPNGGELDHRNNSSVSTYFTADWGTPVGEYPVARDYIKLSSREQDPSDDLYYNPDVPGQEWYYYINTQRLRISAEGLWGYPPELRNAVYVTEAELNAYYNWYCSKIDGADTTYWVGIGKLTKDQFIEKYTDYPYRKLSAGEHYTFMGWYKVDDDGTVASMPYNFNDPVKGDLTIRAKWRLDGGYYVQYDPYFLTGDGTVIIGEMEQWTDPYNPALQLYADQADTHILRAPTLGTDMTGWVFRGWRVVRRDESTDPYEFEGKTYYKWIPIQLDANGEPVYYQPGDPFTIDSALVSEKDDYGGVIHMQAYYERADSTYRKPDVTNLILDANDPYGGYVNTADSTSLPALAGPGSTAINMEETTLYNGHPTQILFGDIQSNLALHLYRYATAKEYNGVQGTEFFVNENGYLLLGFDENEDPLAPANGSPYIPTYAADSVASVTRSEIHKILYALWEPMVYVTFVNTTDEPVTIVLTGTGENTNTVSIVNIATGDFAREATTNTVTVPAKTGDVNGEVKIVLPRAAAGTDSITATATNDHLHKKMSVSGEYPAGTAYGTGSADIRFGEQVTYTGLLVSDPEGIIVTYTEELDTEVLYDVNGGAWTAGVPYQHLTGDIYSIKSTDITNNQYKPSDPILTGKIFIGWTEYASIASQTDFSSTDPVTFGSGDAAITITPEAGGNVLDKVWSEYLWDFSRDAEDALGRTLYAVWSEAVTVSFDIAYSDNGSQLHTWGGPDVSSTQGNNVFYQSGPADRYITYTMAKGDRVPKPSDPIAISLTSPDTSSWNFIRWLIYNDSTKSYKRTAKDPSNDNDTNLTQYAFDFSQPVTEDVTLLSSWTALKTQFFMFTVENHVVGGNENDEFEYTIAVTGEQVYGKFVTGGSNTIGTPNQQWGSVTTTLKNNQEYSVQIKVTRMTSPWTAYSIEIAVVDRDGIQIKNGHVVYCVGNSRKNFVSDYIYTLEITQEAKEGYTTDVGVNPIDTDIIYKLNDPDQGRSFSFTSKENTTTNKPECVAAFGGEPSNGFVVEENNSLKVVFTNTAKQYPTPTGIYTNSLPFALMFLIGLFLVPVVYLDHRRKEVLPDPRFSREKRNGGDADE